MSASRANVSQDGEPEVARSAGEPSSKGTLRVEAVFHDIDERQADQIAAGLIGRAHELANLPEHACDVDVNVEGPRPELRLAASQDFGAADARAR